MRSRSGVLSHCAGHESAGRGARARSARRPRPEFSNDGKQLTTIGVSGYGNGVAIHSDGKIVVAGGSYAGVGGTHSFALARYNADGSLDTSFDGDGKLTTDFGGGVAYGVALQPDGKIVAVGAVGGSGRLRAGPLQRRRLARHARSTGTAS